VVPTFRSLARAVLCAGPTGGLALDCAARALALHYRAAGRNGLSRAILRSPTFAVACAHYTLYPVPPPVRL
jgi:hypothetical protein